MRDNLEEKLVGSGAAGDGYRRTKGHKIIFFVIFDFMSICILRGGLSAGSNRTTFLFSLFFHVSGLGTGGA